MQDFLSYFFKFIRKVLNKKDSTTQYANMMNEIVTEKVTKRHEVSLLAPHFA